MIACGQRAQPVKIENVHGMRLAVQFAAFRRQIAAADRTVVDGGAGHFPDHTGKIVVGIPVIRKGGIAEDQYGRAFAVILVQRIALGVKQRKERVQIILIGSGAVLKNLA